MTTREEGFTLMEILIALFVLLFGILGLVAVFVVSMEGMGENVNSMIAANWARQFFNENRARGTCVPAFHGNWETPWISWSWQTISGHDDFRYAFVPTERATNADGPGEIQCNRKIAGSSSVRVIGRKGVLIVRRGSRSWYFFDSPVDQGRQWSQTYAF